ncbi:hypothetical protein TL16_g09234 [Triparma laevis f. inornata]|uniref:non-specific serine/threonine protein kinase n=1 Tax=Triparma laevis f. inornata TaxID=1714386 RepID=A0A9W7BA31_9STRA|nr:hypothetical protein TL16_g09234 [Triparma laevis f. inornata]
MTDIDGDTGAVGGGCLEDYEIIKPIGKGKFAIVYRAQRKSDSELVALKKIQISSMDPKARSKTLKEVRLLQSLNHPNVIKYLDSFLTDSELIIVFEWAAAGDLKRQIRKALTRNTYFDERVCWKYFSQIAEAILHMHSQRVLHRDLKPANIFLTLNGTVKVGNLGLGRSLSEHTMEAHSKVGTPLYMSPEVLRGSGYDWKSDVWSLGCLLYELACLKSPFKSVGLNLYSLFQKISKGDYKELPGQYSDELKRLAYAMISTEPGDRPDLETVCEVARTMKERTRNDKPKNIPRPPDVVEAVKEGEVRNCEERSDELGIQFVIRLRVLAVDEGPKVEEGKLEEQVEKSVEKEEEKDGQVTPRIETKKTLTPAPVKEPRSTPKLNVDNRGDDSDESDLAGAEPVKQLFGGGGNTSERPVSRSAGRRTGRMEAREPEAAPGEFKNPEEDDVVSIPTRQPEQAKPRTTTSITSSHLLHTTMESVHYKLALLPERCSKKIGFHHFSHASSGSAHTQFLDFLILAEFLMKILGRSISINQDDSPLQLSKQMLNSLSGLLDVKLLSSDDVEEEEVEDEVEVEVEEESVEKWRDVEEFKSEGRDMLNSEVDGREWRIEMERVGPRLKTKGTDAGWRGRVDIMKGLEIETISGLERVAVRVGEERERLVEGERSISNLKAFERIGGEWQEIKKEEEDVKSLRDKLEELCRERSEVLEEVVEEGKSVKVKMESRAEGMSDTGKLVEIRKGMKALESENRNMELMLGVAAATNMSSYVIVNNRSREGDNDDGSSLAGSLSLGSYGGSLENSVDAVGGQDEGSLESS